MAKRELSHRKKKKNKGKKFDKKNKKSQKNKKDFKENFISAKSINERNEKENEEKISIQENLPYESFILKLKGNKKYPKSLEYLSIFSNAKSEWKFNVNFLFNFI